MTDFFYFDQTNQKQGPVDRLQLQELAAQGAIGPDTLVETDTGQKGVAGRIPGLFATTQSSPFAVPPMPPYRGSPQPGYRNPRQYSPGILGFLDFGFTRFITNIWISFIWGVIIIGTLLLWGFSVLSGLITIFRADGEFAFVWVILGLMSIFLSTVLSAFQLLFARMLLEFIIVVFRIEAHLRVIREKYEKKDECSLSV